jgi:hypothetical protein
MPIPTEVLIVVQQLSRYLRIHPHACDTVEGIAVWWLDTDGPVALGVVSAALDCMVDVGVVEARPPAADGRVRYQRAAEVSDSELQNAEEQVAARLGSSLMTFPSSKRLH